MNHDFSQDGMLRGAEGPRHSRSGGGAASWDLHSPGTSHHSASHSVDHSRGFDSVHQIWNGGSSSEL